MPRKPSRTTLTRQLDTVFSAVVRSRGACQRCGSTRNLQCAHIVSRANRRLRWDELNSLALCARCHFWGHAHPLAFAEFVRTEFPGPYDYVMEQANILGKWTDEELVQKRDYLRSLLAEEMAA